MVILTHILKHSLSNSSTTLNVFIEDNRFTGLGKIFWLNSVRHITSQKTILISDLSLLSIFAQDNAIPISPPNEFDRTILVTPSILCIDSLEQLQWLIGKEELQKVLRLRSLKGYGTITVVNKNYADQRFVDSVVSIASVIVIVIEFARCKGKVQCVHNRAYLKTSEEFCCFEICEDLVREVKEETKVTTGNAPKTTFRLGVSEEEKRMREVTPLPYEKVERIIKIGDEDAYECDEEGDEDDFY